MSMAERFEKFRTSLQPVLQLEIAAEDFFEPGVPEAYRKEYGAYLRRRIRPAIELLVEKDDSGKLEILEKLGWFPRNQTDDFLRLAIRKHKNEALVWLLKLKEETYGFTKQDFSL